MEVVNVSGLKNNPSEALRKARKGPVVVMNRDHPDAVLVHLAENGALSLPGVKTALATALFEQGHLSLGRAARIAGLSASEFSRHLSRLGIPVVRGEAQDVEKDMQTLDEWLASS